jgi:O-antigen ligase
MLLGCFEAGYGIVQYLTGWQKIFTYTKKSGLGEASGTFINRNHFAGFLELVLPFVLASAFYSFQVWAGRRGSFSMRRATGDRSSGVHQFLFYLFLLIVMVVAVIFSRSRAGILATLFTIILMAALAQLRTGSKAWLLGVLAFFGTVLGYGPWIGLGPVLARFEGIGEPGYLQIEGRFAIWKDTLRLIHDFPLTGSGLGTFDLVFRQYQTTSVNFLVDHAHNDFLEFASDTGLPGAALLFLPILYLLGRMILSFLDDPRSYRRAVALGCIGSTTALLLHSITDFNLQIPSNALVFAVVLGIGYRVACLDRRAEAQMKSPPDTPRG